MQKYNDISYKAYISFIGLFRQKEKKKKKNYESYLANHLYISITDVEFYLGPICTRTRAGEVLVESRGFALQNWSLKPYMDSPVSNGISY